MDSHKKFRALYYPYSRCIHPVDLKRALLVFDEILFVDPLSRDITEHPGQYPQYLAPQILCRSGLDNPGSESLLERTSDRFPQFDLPKWYDVREYYEELQKQKIVRLIDPAPYIKEHDRVITGAILSDLIEGIRPPSDRDSIFPYPWKFSGQDKFGWRIHANRIPQSFREVFSDVGLLRACIDQMDWTGIIAPIDSYLERKDEYLGFLEQEDDGAIVAPFQLAFSAILNQAMVISEELEAFPVTDDSLSHSGLLEKASKLHTSKAEAVQSVLPRRSLPDLYRIQAFTLSVVSRLIPDEALEKIEISALLDFREDNRSALNGFRDKMTELSAKITANAWGSDFQREVLRLIDTEVVPEVNRVDLELSDNFRKLFGATLTKVAQAGGKILAPALPSLTMAAFLALTPGQIVLCSAAGVLAGIGMVAPDLVSYWRDRHTIANNGLSFLLNFKNQYIART